MSASISRSVTVVGFLLTSVAAGVVLGATHAVDSYDAMLLGVAGILIGINVIAVGIWMSDNPAAARAICKRQRGVLGVVMASSAVTAVAAGAVDPLLCFGLLVLLLVGISLVMHGALGLGAPQPHSALEVAIHFGAEWRLARRRATKLGGRSGEKHGGAAGEEERVRDRRSAGGFIASWLVKLLLSRGHYVVNGTVRDRGDGKNAHLKALENSGERLHLLKANLLDYNSVVLAVAGCEGVFHVASPVPSGRPLNPEADVISHAVTGTLNVLKACYEAKVKQVVVVSSVASVFNNPNWPKSKVFNEDSWSDEEYCRKNEEWYFLSKTLAEHEAFAYAARTGLNIVTICPSLVIGPLMQSTVNTSTKIFLSYFKGDCETVENRLRNLVDVRDVADALLLAYENSEAYGRYLCSSTPIKVSDMVNILKTLYPTGTYPKNFVEVEDNISYSTEKLEKLGWTFRPAEETLRDSIDSCRAFGILN